MVALGIARPQHGNVRMRHEARSSAPPRRGIIVRPFDGQVTDSGKKLGIIPDRVFALESGDKGERRNYSSRLRISSLARYLDVTNIFLLFQSPESNTPPDFPMKNCSQSRILSRSIGKRSNRAFILDRSIATRVSAKLFAIGLGIWAGAVSPSVMAATFIWDGGAGNANMDTAANWNPDTVPNGANSDVAQWNGTVAGNLSLTYTAAGTGAGLANAPGVSLDIASTQVGNVTINEASGTVGLRMQNITVASGAGALTFGGLAGTDNLTLSSSAVPNNTFTNNSSNPVTFSSDVAFAAGNGVTHTLTLTGTGNWNVNTSLIRSGTGTINVVKDGSGAMNLGSVNALGNAAFTIIAGTLDNTSGAALTMTNTTQTWNGNFAFSTAAGTTNNSLNLGTGTVSLGSAAGTSRTITTNGSGLLTSGGVISNGTTANSLIKAGTGGLFLNAGNTYSGGTTLNAGDLQVGTDTALGTGGLMINGGTLTPRLAPRTLANAVTVGGDFTLGAVGVNNSITLAGPVDLGGAVRTITVADTTLSPDATLAGVVSNGGLTKAGAGTLALTGTSSLTGATTVAAGTLLLSGTGSINTSSGITINGSGAKFVQTSSVSSTPAITLTQGTLDGTGVVGAVSVGASSAAILANGNATTATLTTGNLSFSGAATVNIASAATGVGIAAGTLATSGTDGAITININRTGAWNNGANNLISYTSFPSADINDFALGGLIGPALGARQTFGGLILNGNNIAFQVNGTSIYWTGLQSNQWTVNPVGGLQNWKQTSDNVATEFIDGDDVVFNDTPGTNQTVQIDDGNVSTTTITFNNSTAVNYAIASNGGFGISSGSLAKNGTGSVTINTANTYTGGTTINAGTLNASSASALGAGVVTVNAGTLNVSDATALGTGALTMNGGTLDNTSGGPMTLATNNVQNWNGDFTFTGTNSLDVGTGAVNLGGSGSRTITVSANTLAAGEVRSGTTQGLIKQGAGTLAFTSTGVGNAGSLLGGTLEVASGTVQINRTGDVVAGDFTATGLTGNGTIINGAAIERWLIINMTGTQTFSGTLANGDVGALGLSKQGNGTLILTGASSYTGTTTVGGGILNVQNSDALGMSTLVNQAAGNRNSGIQLQGNISLPGSVNFRLSNDGGLQGPATVAYAIDNVSGNNTINGTITLTSGGGNSVIQSDSGALTLAGTVTSDQTRTLILQGASTDANTVSGAISNGTAGINSVSKSGVGTWTLSGANGYTGMTTVSNGTLTINSANSGAGTNVTLNGGSSLVLGNTQALGAASLINLTPAGTATLTYATDGGDTAYQLSMSSGSTFNIVLNRATADSTVTHNLSTAASLSGFGSGTVSFTKGSNVTTLATASFDQFNLGGGGGGNTVISPGPGTNVIIGTATKSNNNVSQTLELGGVTTDNEITGEISNGLATGLIVSH
jgi:autotransporter-associated beta strand protein